MITCNAPEGAGAVNMIRIKVANQVSASSSQLRFFLLLFLLLLLLIVVVAVVVRVAQ